MTDRFANHRPFENPILRGIELPASFAPAVGCVRMTVIRAAGPLEPRPERTERRLRPPAARPARGPRPTPNRVDAPEPPPRPQPAPNATRAAPPPSAPPALRTSIPAEFCEPWLFRHTREEAAYDMQRARAETRLGALLAHAARRFSSGAELEKWHVLLAGRTPEEQLFSVRPPKGRLTDPLIREWAARTLERARFDVNVMLPEWEIHWRRRGE